MALTGDWSVDLTDLENPLAYIERKLRESLETPDISDPMAAYVYLNTRRQAVREAAKQRPLMRLWDKNMRYIGPITKEKSVVVEEVAADSGTATIALRHDTILTNFLLYDRRAEEDIHITVDPDPHNRTWETRWGGKLTAASSTRNSDGTHTVELEAIHNREHMKHILAAANPVLPPEFQLPRSWLLPWNLRTALGITMGINLFRQYFPVMNIWSNLFNPGAWLDTRLLNVTPLNWPVCPQFINPLTDQSRTSVVSSTWDDMHTISGGPMKDAGVMAKAYTWLPEDATSPHPELGKLGDALARPTRPQVVIAFEDKSGVTGLTGTLLDGPINLIAATADDLITETIIPLDLNDKDNDGKGDPFLRKLLGAAPAKPKVVFREGEHTGIISAKRTLKAATAKTIHTGGRSPGWVNQLQTFGIKFGLSQLQLVITEGMFSQQGQAPVGSGLEELYQGQLDNTALAWQRFTDPARVLLMGDYGFLEHRERGSGSAYTVSGILDLRTGHFKTRGGTAFKTEVINGRPWSLFEHFTLGDRLAFQLGNTLHVDQLTGWRMSYDVSTPIKYELSLGGELDDDDPFARGMATLAAFWNTFGAFLGSGSLF